MGLDVTAYKNLKRIDCVFDEDGGPIDPVSRESIEYDLHPYVNFDFPGAECQIVHGAVYSAEESMRGWSGGYGRYNSWREQLAKLAGYNAIPYDRHGTGRTELRHDAAAWKADAGPFRELINFSDCEGVIGADISAKLAKDFADFQQKADETDDEMFIRAYNNWRECFEMAAENGAVSFH